MSVSRASLVAVALITSVLASPTFAHAEPPPPSAPPAPSSSASSSPPSSALRTVGLVDIGVGITLIVGGTLVALSGLSLKSRIDDQCPNKVCPSSASGDLDALRGRQTAVNVFWGFGAVAVITGVAIVLSTGRSDGSSSETRSGQVSIVPAPGGLAGRLTF